MILINTYESNEDEFDDYLDWDYAEYVFNLLDKECDGWVARGYIRRWDGVRRGFSLFKELPEAIDEYRIGGSLLDIKIEVEGDHITINGSHHDGGMTIEIYGLNCSISDLEDELSSDLKTNTNEIIDRHISKIDLLKTIFNES